MKIDELVAYNKKQAETINTLADNQRVLIDRISKLENRDATVDTELAINKAVDKIVSSVQKQVTPAPAVPATPAPAPVAEPTPTPAPAEPVAEPEKPKE